MTQSGFNVDGVERLRLLSDRQRSQVYLSRAGGELRVLKLEQPGSGMEISASLARYDHLRKLGWGEGLFPILDHGVAEGGWVWQLMPVGDCLPGLPGLEADAGVAQYEPMTLRSRTRALGPVGAGQVALWGQRLCSGLGLLHGAGLIHRDMKPANVIFLSGEPRLGDYGLVGEPGSEFDFSGTEGFLPLEGTNEPGTDLYALGRTLYEAWTGRDRLEFPSLPKGVLETPEWVSHGMALNEVILRSNSVQKGRRFGSAEEFRQALRDVELGRRRTSRRVWLRAGAVAGAGAMAGFAILRGRSAGPLLKWELERKPGFAMEAWRSNPQTLDWATRQVYSMSNSWGNTVCQLVEVDTLNRMGLEFKGRKLETWAIAYDPVRKVLMGGNYSKGDVFEWNPAMATPSGSGGAPRVPQGQSYEWTPGRDQIVALGGGPTDWLHQYAAGYWNPVTKRVGIFGGGGGFQFKNDRWEFDVGRREWVEMEAHDLKKGVWPRGANPLFYSDPEDPVVYLFGGCGSPLGVTGKEVPGLAGFNGASYDLDDIWRLDLEGGGWTQLVPCGRFGMARLVAVFRLPTRRELVAILRKSNTGRKSDPARAFLLSLDRPGQLRELDMEGVWPELAHVQSYGIDPKDGRLLIMADEAFYRVSF